MHFRKEAPKTASVAFSMFVCPHVSMQHSWTGHYEMLRGTVKKSKDVSVHARTACRWRRIASLILTLGNRWKWVVSITLRPRYLRVITPQPI
jgi:hypothetical protein